MLQPHYQNDSCIKMDSSEIHIIPFTAPERERERQTDRDTETETETQRLRPQTLKKKTLFYKNRSLG